MADALQGGVLLTNDAGTLIDLRPVDAARAGDQAAFDPDGIAVELTAPL